MSYISWERCFTTSTFSIFCILIALPFHSTYSLQPQWTVGEKLDCQKKKNHKMLNIKAVNSIKLSYFIVFFMLKTIMVWMVIFWDKFWTKKKISLLWLKVVKCVCV